MSEKLQKGYKPKTKEFTPKTKVKSTANRKLNEAYKPKTK